jgi:lipopolysaccharide/colanic/teichoic acid biosynthesis glycosyltransferase
MTTTFEPLPQAVPAPAAAPPASRTVFGLDPIELHHRYWAAFGVQVVRQGEPSQIVRDAELYLLTEPRALPLFSLAPVIETLQWAKPLVVMLRIHDNRHSGYRERVVVDGEDRFRRFDRIYESPGRLARVVLTPDREIAKLWQRVRDPITGWRRLRKFIPRADRATMSIQGGSVYDRLIDRDMADLLTDLLRQWKRPDATISRLKKIGDSAWADRDASVDPAAKLIGPVWVGAGRTINATDRVVGPAIVWDSPDARPTPEGLQWLMIEPTEPPMDATVSRPITPLSRAFKRGFDIVFSIVALLLTSFVYPFVMAWIWIEDGRPFFYYQVRETLDGREFRCWKFRSMVNNSAELTAKLIAEGKNLGDGGRVYIDPAIDPRLLKIGKLIRKYNIDEFPQFWNVLKGDMSLVGPRPSPRKENQFCPSWREARLSVRPGITGLWQTLRTRRAGQDFQEWIKYDIEYVETMSPWLDVKIIWRTIAQLLRKGTRQ